MAWGQVNRLGVGENYVCCLAIVVIGGAEVGALNSLYNGKLMEESHKGEIYMEELMPQLV